MRSVILLGCAALYLLLAWPALQKPLMIDETVFAMDAAAARYGQFGMWHPPFYFDLLRGLYHLGGLRDQALRVLGVVGVLLNFLLAARLCRQVAHEEQIPNMTPWVWLGMATHPLLVQGSTILDIDTTILPSLILLFLVTFLLRATQPTLPWLVGIAGCFFLNLWAKMTTSLALPVSVGLWYALQRQWRLGFRVTVWLVVIGGGLFLGAWWWYAHAFDLPYGAVFGRTVGAFTSEFYRTWLPPVVALLNRCVRVGLWIGPFTLALFGLGLWSRLAVWKSRRNLKTLDLCWLVATILLVGYCLIGGTMFGFAKYHVPWVPLAAVCVASAAARMSRPRLITLAVACVAVGLTVGVGFDPLYWWNYRVRLAAILEPSRAPALVWQLVGFLGLYAMLMALVVRLERSRPIVQRWMIATLVSAIVWNVGLAWQQRYAPYSTTYIYGRNVTEMRQLAGRLTQVAAQRPGSSLVAPEDVLFIAGLPWSEYPSHRVKELDGFLAALRDPRVAAIVTSPVWNEGRFFREVFDDPQVRRLLDTHFIATPLGLSTVWLRRD